MDFPCTGTEPSPEVPTSGIIGFMSNLNLVFSLQMICLVHQLRPGDIKYVAAIGDSLTVSILKRKIKNLYVFNDFRQVLVQVLIHLLHFLLTIVVLHGGTEKERFNEIQNLCFPLLVWVV